MEEGSGEEASEDRGRWEVRRERGVDYAFDFGGCQQGRYEDLFVSGRVPRDEKEGEGMQRSVCSTVTGEESPSSPCSSPRVWAPRCVSDVWRGAWRRGVAEGVVVFFSNDTSISAAQGPDGVVMI